MMKLNKDKNIGRVLFIVEGGRTEFSLLKKIFVDILDYNYIERRRTNRANYFQSNKNRNSKVAVINTEQSHISYIEDGELICSGQFGPYASNTKGVQFKNLKFKSYEKEKMYGPKINVVMPESKGHVQLTEKTYKEIMANSFGEYGLNIETPNLSILYNSTTEEPDVQFRPTLDGDMKIWAIIN